MASGRLDLASLHRPADVVGLADRKRDNRQGRIAGSTGRELTAVRDEQIPDVMRLPIFVDDAVARLFAHPICPQVMGAGVRGRRERARRSDCVVHRGALLVRMIAHGDVVGVVVIVDARDRHSVGVLHHRIERDPVGLLRQVLADQPHPGHVRIAVDRRREAAAPGARVEEGGHERQAERQRFHLVAAAEAALRIVPGLVHDDPGHRGAAVHVHGFVEHGVHAAGHVPHVVAADLAGAVGEAIRKHVRSGC